MPDHYPFQGEILPSGSRLVGYAALKRQFDLPCHAHDPAVTFDAASRRERVEGWRVVHGRQAPNDHPIAHLDFALRHEDLNLQALDRFFACLDPSDITAYVASRLLGVAQRKAWFLYEWLTEKQLPLADITTGNYLPVLDPDHWHTFHAERSPRHRITNTLAPTSEFCPLIRRSTQPRPDYAAMMRDVLTEYPTSVTRRAVQASLIGETMATFEIENVTPSEGESRRWALAIETAGGGPLRRERIEALQKDVLGERFSGEWGYRSNQIYVGTRSRDLRPTPQMINARPIDVPRLMDGWQEWMAGVYNVSNSDPIAAAAAASFGFLYIHPLRDGNGRLHRYMLHHVLSDLDYTPANALFPVSMPMLNRGDRYMATLKAFDELVMPYTQWRETNDGGQGLEVLNDTRHLFRFPELTRELGYFEECLGVAVSEVDAEIKHTISYDRAMANIRQAADLPDDRVRDFVMFVLQNNGTLPRRRVKKDFADIDPDTLSEMETAVQEAFDLSDEPSSNTTPSP